MLTCVIYSAFTWSTPSPVTPGVPPISGTSMNSLRTQPNPVSRNITPDLSQFDTLTPSTTQFSQPLQPQGPYKPPLSNYHAPTLQPQTSFITTSQPSGGFNGPALQSQSNYQAPIKSQQQTQSFPKYQGPPTSINWGAAASSSPWADNHALAQNSSLSSIGNAQSSMSNLVLNQRPAISNSQSFSLPPPPGAPSHSFDPISTPSFGQTRHQKTGLDAFESLI